MPSIKKRLVYLVTDKGGMWEGKWEFVVMAFSDEGAANECAKKRMERHESSSMGEFDDCCYTTVECVELIDCGDEKQERNGTGDELIKRKNLH